VVTRQPLLERIAADRPTIERRFWSHVGKHGADDCWEWTGYRQPNRYGRFGVARLPEMAHRVSFALAFGWLPPAVLHKCDNPPCVNPRHLFGGTAADNIADAVAKDRYRQIPKAVEATILTLAELGLTQAAIARQVGVNRRTVRRRVEGAKR
jgi:hypothetical protein